MTVERSRYLIPWIQEDFDSKKMFFLGGPRQVGKTTLALSFLEPWLKTHPCYLNWDIRASRLVIQKVDWPFVSDARARRLLILDEVHKYSKWKTTVQGLYDSRGDPKIILVTGSSRLDLPQGVGDSLHGRYHYYRLHPFSLLELAPKAHRSSAELLLKMGGFLKCSLRTASDFGAVGKKNIRRAL